MLVLVLVLSLGETDRGEERRGEERRGEEKRIAVKEGWYDAG